MVLGGFRWLWVVPCFSNYARRTVSQYLISHPVPPTFDIVAIFQSFHQITKKLTQTETENSMLMQWRMKWRRQPFQS